MPACLRLEPMYMCIEYSVPNNTFLYNSIYFIKSYSGWLYRYILYRFIHYCIMYTNNIVFFGVNWLIFQPKQNHCKSLGMNNVILCQPKFRLGRPKHGEYGLHVNVYKTVFTGSKFPTRFYFIAKVKFLVTQLCWYAACVYGSCGLLPLQFLPRGCFLLHRMRCLLRYVDLLWPQCNSQTVGLKRCIVFYFLIALRTSQTCSFAKWYHILHPKVAFEAPWPCARCGIKTFPRCYSASLL